MIAFHHEKTDAREAFITLTIKLINRLHKNNLLQILLLSAHLYFNFHLKKKQNTSLPYQKNIKIVKGRVRRVRLKIANVIRISPFFPTVYSFCQYCLFNNSFFSTLPNSFPLLRPKNLLEYRRSRSTTVLICIHCFAQRNRKTTPFVDSSPKTNRQCSIQTSFERISWEISTK